MKRLLAKFTPSPSMVVAMLALVVAMSGSAYAAVTINGKNIKSKSVAGTKLKNNTITGTQVKESKLGRVPLATRADLANQADNAANAAKVGGAALAGLVQGGGHVYHGQASGSPTTNANVVLVVPGIGRVEFNCAAGGVFAQPYFVNASGGSLYVMGQTIARDGTPANTDEANMSPNVPGLADGNYTNLQDPSQSPTRSGGSTTFQVWSSSGAPKSATFNVSSIFCAYTASATTNQ